MGHCVTHATCICPAAWTRPGPGRRPRCAASPSPFTSSFAASSSYLHPPAMFRLAASSLSMRRVLPARRCFSAATPAAAGKIDKNATVPTRYMPPTAKGRYVIEQLNEHWSSCIAAVEFARGDVIGTAPGIFHARPTRFTVQADTDKHLEFAGGLEYVNHSCEPNARLVVSENTPEVAFVATKAIKEGEYVTFDYATSEWDMDEKFDCRCGSKKCRGHIGGAKYLNEKQVGESMALFTPSVLRLLLQSKLQQ